MSDTDSKYAESLVSQDVLDGLMKDAEELETTGASAEETSDLDLVSSEDIEKLLKGNSTEDEEESELNLISQDDIDSLISGEELGETVSADQNDSDAGSLISQDDIDALLSGSVPEEKQAPVDNSADEEPDDSLISQDDIDALLGGGDEPEDTGGEDDLVSQDDIDALLSSTDSDVKDEPEDSEEVLISQDDIDALLGSAGDDDDSSDSEEALISQDDIDNLLQEAGGEEAEEEKLVSQDDIDKLLADDSAVEEKEVSQDDIDKLLADDSLTEEKDVPQDDINALLNADVEDSGDDTGAKSDQVILEKGSEGPEDGEQSKLKKLLSSKVFLACAASVILIIAAGVGFTIFSDKSAKVESVSVQENTEEIADLEEELLGEDEIGEEGLAEVAFLTVELKDFVVPAPAQMKNISYISLDISLEIVDVTSNPIKGYEPFFRNIIYEVLNKALLLQNESSIIEADLVRMIKRALDDALSEGSVGKVNFLEFNLT